MSHPMWDRETDGAAKPDRDPSLSRLTPQERYARDPEFHALVASIEAMIARCDFTPTELREAVGLAAYLHEVRIVRHSVV